MRGRRAVLGATTTASARESGRGRGRGRFPCRGETSCSSHSGYGTGNGTGNDTGDDGAAERSLRGRNLHGCNSHNRNLHGRNLHLYGLHLQQNCTGLPQLGELMQRLQSLQSRFQAWQVDMEAPCSHGVPQGCWILEKLTAFNTILVLVDVELKEELPARLALCSLDVELVARFRQSSVLDACILFHLLLKGHRCIQTLSLSKGAVMVGYPSLLCDALACNRGLKNLTISCWDFPASVERSLTYALCRMPSLETLRICKLLVSPSSASRIAHLLKKSTKLFLLEFLENEMTAQAGEELMRGLRDSPSIKVLRLDDNALGPLGSQALGQFLALETSQLEELSLRYVPEFDGTQLSTIVASLGSNRTLRALELRGCLVNDAGINALAEAVKDNNKLQSLSLVGCNVGGMGIRSLAIMLEFNQCLKELDLRDNQIDDAAAMRLARALVFNRTLRRLNLEGNDINALGVVDLVGALAKNNTLEELLLGYVEVNDDMECYGDISTTLRKSGAYSRVRLSYDARGVFQLSHNLGYHADRITSVHLDSSVELETQCLKALFVALTGIPSLETLHIDAQACMDASTARKLARVFVTTKTLRRVQVNTSNAEPLALVALMKALRKNRSISHLEMEYSMEDTSSTQAFLDMVAENKTLHYFSYISTKKDELVALARGLASNRVLTTLKIWDKPGFGEIMFEVHQVLRRNLSFLNRAVEFALDPERFGVRRFPAYAFDTLCDTDSFAEHLARVTPNSRELRRNARRHITSNLFAITGVCRGQVRCNEGRRPQIDILNWECWLEIFSYLRTTDIPACKLRC